MRQLADAWLERQRRRFTRCDAARYRRFDPRFHRSRSTVDRKAYNPDQPRVPAGSAEGGQWTGGDGETPVRLASTERPLPPRAAVRFAVQMALGLIRSYRIQNNLNDAFDHEHGTVALTKLNDKWIFGTNSDVREFSTAYTDRDEAAANELRDRMLEKYPDVMTTDNIGQKPNDALYHAETTALLRAREQNGGTLEDKELLVFVDGKMCPSCEILLPKIGLELGNPKVTFIDRAGRMRAMRDGRWDD